MLEHSGADIRLQLNNALVRSRMLDLRQHLLSVDFWTAHS
jgi:hypothetical protein